MFTVRRAEKTDAAAAVDVVRQSITESCTADHLGNADTLAKWLSNKTVQHFVSWLANADNFCVVAEAGGRLLGVGLLHRSGDVNLFYLVPSAQRQGIGKAIHFALEERAKAWRLAKLKLDSTFLARTFYERLGYRPAGSATPRFGVLQVYPYEKTLAGPDLDCGLCVVRDWRPSDKASLVRVANNRNVWRNLTHRFPHPYTDADADSWFAQLEKTSRRTHWAIEVDGKAVGGIGFEPGEGVHARSARFGYWLGEPYWRRGIMTAAARAISDHALEHFDVVRLEAPVFEWNPASMRVLEKCGFVREGVLRRSIFKDGQLIDAVLYARIR